MSGPASPSSPEVERLARALSVTETVAAWLIRLGHGDTDATRRYLDPKLAHLTDPSAMVDRGPAADRIARAVRSGETIAVFGDYDCDGITSAAIVTEFLRALGGTAVPLLASRFEGGYGLSAAAAERVLGCGAKLLVTCDCGSSDHVSIARLKERGIDTVVIDHHLVPAEPLPAVAFLNPHRPECGFPYKGLASCGLALSLAAAVRSALGRPLDVRRWLDLVAIGTIADVAPLDGDNRTLVRAGLDHLISGMRPGIAALVEVTMLDRTRRPSARDVAFTLAPRLNAPGRLGSPVLALELLLARDAETARQIAASLESLSERRKALQAEIFAQAVEEIEREGYSERSAIVVGREGWGSGIVGIVAGKLADRYARPVVVVGFENGEGRGSVRGPKGARLFDALSRTASLLTRFGGHQAAAGLEVPIARLAELRAAFESAVDAVRGESAPDPLADALPLSGRDDPLRVLRDFERLEPCGQGNPLPKLRVSGTVAAARELRGGHLRLEVLLADGHRLGCFGVGMASEYATLEGPVSVVGDLRRDSYRGGDAIELFLSSVVRG
ncbi:MAG TPA: single-stranded-DNA-specific exonuclease RecJ [Polyangiaceae bacterium]|nr:single-stranded-DNA-specific exonuclease RecJ [Polyangiaceae bacterium]